jgi:hypothetical protein
MEPYSFPELTFIVLANKLGEATEPTNPSQEQINEACPMIGDVNLFFNVVQRHEEVGESTNLNGRDELEVEVEVMIAGEWISPFLPILIIFHRAFL